MPLIIITGIPSSGKTKRTIELKRFFESEHKKTVHVVCENSIIIHSGLDKNNLFLHSSKEKQIRGAIKADAHRLIGPENIVIIDAANYIKGYRYELYCMSKTSKTTQCTIHCEAPVDTAWKFNSERPEEDRYSREIFDALTMRYEAPDSRNRWDSPLFLVLPEDELDLAKIYSTLYERNAPPPNQSTQNPPLSATNFLYEFDRITQDIVNAILAAQRSGQEGEVKIPGSDCTFQTSSTLTAPQLTRLRRQFLAYTKLHPTKDTSKVGSLFAQFLNSSIN